MRKIYLLVAFVLLYFQFAQAQFTTLNGPPGGYVSDLERNGSTLYAVVSNTLYQSTNSGTSWTKTTITTPASGIAFEDLYIGPSGKYYGLTYSELYTSADGTNWTKSSTTSFYGLYRLKRFGPDGYLVASGWNGVWISTDDGVTFTQILFENVYDEYRVSSNSAGDLFLATSTGIQRYLYPGASGTFDPANWELVFPMDGVYWVNVGVDNSDNIYASTQEYAGGTYPRLLSRSTAANKGAVGTWSLLPHSGIAGTDLNGFWGFYQNTVFFFNNGNGGKVYSQTDVSPTNYTLTGATTANSDYITVASTTEANEGDVVTGTGIPFGSYITSIASATELYISKQCTATNVGISITGSKQASPWTEVDAPTYAFGAGMRNAVIISSSNYFIGSDGSGVFSTSNSGTNFTQTSSGIFAGNGSDVAVGNSTDQIIYINNYNSKGYWTSTNSGTTWSFITLNNYVRNVEKLMDGTILLYGDLIYRSMDNGATFTELVSTGYVRNLVTDPNNTSTANTNIVYYEDGFNLYKSTDSGLTWNAVTIPASVPARSVNAYIEFITVNTSGDIYFLERVYNSSTNKDDWSLYKISGSATTKIPSGPWINEMYWGANNLFIQNGKLFVTSYNAVYTTSDDGAAWATNGFSGNAVFPISQGGFSGLAVSRNGTLYISQTDGKTFNSNTLPSSNATITNMVLDNSGNFIASAQTSPALKFTGTLLVDPATIPAPIDFGWVATNGPYGGPTEHILKDNTDKLYTFSWRGYYKSNIAATSWTKLNYSQQEGYFNYMALNKSTGKLYAITWGNLYTSIDGGTTWSQVANSENINQRGKIIVSSNGNLVMNTYDDKVYISTDEGATFGAPKLTLPNDEHHYGDHSFLTTSNNAIFMRVYKENVGHIIKRSTDGGTTWSDVPVPANEVWQISADANGNVFVMTCCTIYKSSDDGANWTPITGINNGWAYEAKIYVGPTGDFFFPAYGTDGNFVLKKSTDGGTTWTDLGSLGSENVFDINWVGTKIVAAAFSGAIASTDDGATFTEINTGITNVIDGKLLVGSATRINVASADFSFKTENSGTSWSKVTPRLRKFFDHPDGSVIAIGNDASTAFRSTDGGVTWTPYYSANFWADKYFTADGVNHYAIAYNEIYYSNNLTTWTKLIVSGMPSNDKRYFNDISADNNGLIYCILYNYVTNKTEAYQILFGSGILLNQVSAPQTLFFKNDKTYLFGQEGTLATTTDGSTWTKKAAPNGYKFSIEAKDYFFVYQWGGLLWLSRDLGLSWQNVGLTTNTYNFNDVALNELDGYAYATIDGSPVRKSDKIIIPDDATAPLSVSYNPANNATGINIKPLLTITFDEGVIPQATKTLRILDVANQVTPVETILVTDGVQSGKSYTFTPTTFLGYNKQYFIVIDAGAFKDIFGNSYAGLLSNTTWRFTTKVAPTVVSTVPVNSSTGVSIIPNFSVTFSEAITGASGKNVYVYETASASTPASTISATTPTPQFVRILPDGAAASQSVKLIFDATFGGKELVDASKVYAHAGVVLSDAAGTNWDYVVGNWGTDDGIGEMTQVPGETDRWQLTLGPSLREYFGVPAGTAIYRLALVFRNASGTLKATAPVSVPTGQFLAGNGDYYVDLAPTAPACVGQVTREGNNLVITGCDTLKYQTQYFIKFDPLALLSVEGQPTSLITTNSDWTFTTRNTPSVLSTNPVNGASGANAALINTSLSITFSENVTVVGSNKMYVTNTAVPETPVETISLSAATIVGATATFTLSNPLSYSTTYSITFDANSFKSASDNGNFSVFTSNGWQFTTEPPPDTESPSITYSPDTFVKGSGSKTISATISDNVGVTSAKIFYRSITTSTAESSTDLTLTNGKYEVSIPESTFGSMGLELYFTAADAAGNTTRSPATSGYHYIKVTGPATGEIFPSGLLGSGGELAGWKIISVPTVTDGTPISSVFSEFGDVDNTKWRMILYKDESSDWLQYPKDFSAFKQGDGYFINVKNPPSQQIVIDGALAPANNRTNLFKMTLKAGWNLIGNPYTFPMKWSEILAFNSGVTTTGVATLKTYSNGTYVNNANNPIAAYEGAFVLNTGSSQVTIDVPVVTSLSGGRIPSGPEPKAECYDIGTDEWVVPITLKTSDVMNILGGIGMKKNALFGVDQFDDFNPPPVTDYVEMRFAHLEHFLKQSTRDFVPTQSEYMWKFTLVSSIDKPIELSWDNLSFGENSKELFLVDVENGILIDMRKQNSYTARGKSGPFELHFGEDLKNKISPNKIVLGDAYPNPSNGNVSIPFTLPEGGNTYQTTLEIYDPIGRKITNLVDKSLPSGFYTSQWYSDQSNLNSGVYIYKLTVVQAGKVQQFTKRLIINKSD